jgi:hypothetical protein
MGVGGAQSPTGRCVLSWKWFLFGERGKWQGLVNLSEESVPGATRRINEKILSLLHRWLVKKE